MRREEGGGREGRYSERRGEMRTCIEVVGGG